MSDAPSGGAPPAAPTTPQTPNATPDAKGQGQPAQTAPNGEQPPKLVKVRDPRSGKLVERPRADVERELISQLSDEDLVSARELRAGAHRKLEEAAKVRREAEERIARLKDPKQVVKALRDLYGDDAKRIDDAFLEHYEGEYKRAAMSPEERERWDREAKLLEREKALAEREKRDQDRQRTEAAERYKQAFTNAYKKAASEVGLPAQGAAGVDAMQRWAAIAQGYVERGERFDPREVAELVRDEMREADDMRLNAYSDDELEERIGQERLKRLVKRYADRRRAQVAAPTQPKPAVRRDEPSNGSGRKESFSDFFSGLRR